jgi:hypothetical protein
MNPHRLEAKSSCRSITALAIAGFCASSALASAAPLDSTIAQLTRQVSPDSIRQHVQRLQDFQTRYALSDSCRAAERYLHDYFSAQGLDSVAFDTVSYQGTSIRNVIGTIRGTVDPKALIVLCAHIDAISPTPTLCAPGAEDNASGIAVVMEAARILGKSRPKYTIKLVGFTGEEEGFIGSEHMAQALRASDTRIAALLNLDMIAWPGGAFGVKVLCDSATQVLASLEVQAIHSYTALDPQTVVRIPLPSDNYPFQTRGYPCLSNIERMEQSTDAYVWYHTCGDTIGHMSMALAAEVAKAATATLMMLMDIPAPPAGLVGSAGDSGAIRVQWAPNQEKDLAGYVLRWGATSGKYADSLLVGAQTTFADIATPAGDSGLFLSLTASDSAGNASWPSFEASLQSNAGLSPPRKPGEHSLPFAVRKSGGGLEIQYGLDRAEMASLSILTLSGRTLKTLVQERQAAGTYRVRWDLRDAEGQRGERNMVIVRLNGRCLKVLALE